MLPISLDGFAEDGLSNLADALHTEHEKLFTFKLDVPIELVNLRVTALGKAANVTAEKIEEGS